MKKVLIVTYYWPPSAGSGVQRWVKFSKYLPEYGWEPVIFTPENPDFNVKDETLNKDLSKELEVIKFPIWEPYHLQRKLAGEKGNSKPAEILEKKRKGALDKFAIWIRGNILVPDPRIFWVIPSYKFLKEMIKAQNIEVVITTGPPHSLHLIGMQLKNHLGIKWIADFRDPWSTWELMDTLYMSPIVKSIHRKIEKKVLTKADKIITISKSFKEDFERLSGRSVSIITNGFDPDDFYGANDVKQLKKCQISHIGTIDDLRDPRPFLKAVKNLLQENEGWENEIEVLFVGIVSKKLIAEVQDDPILSKIVKFKSYVAHHEVFALYKKSSILLLVLAKSVNAEGNIPGKLFEYMASERPILVLGKKDGNAAAIIKDSHAGVVCDPADLDDIKAAIKGLLENIHSSTAMNVSIQKYSRKNLTGRLVKILNEVIDEV